MIFLRPVVFPQVTPLYFHAGLSCFTLLPLWTAAIWFPLWSLWRKPCSAPLPVLYFITGKTTHIELLFQQCLLKIYARCLGACAQKLPVVLQSHLAISKWRKENCFFYDLPEIYLLQVSIMKLFCIYYGLSAMCFRWSSLNVLHSLKSLQRTEGRLWKSRKKKRIYLRLSFQSVSPLFRACVFPYGPTLTDTLSETVFSP